MAYLSKEERMRMQEERNTELNRKLMKYNKPVNKTVKNRIKKEELKHSTIDYSKKMKWVNE